MRVPAERGNRHGNKKNIKVIYTIDMGDERLRGRPSSEREMVFRKH